MNKLFLSITAIFVFATSCNTANTKIKEYVSGADSVAINYFRGDGRMDTVVKVKIITDKKIITQLTDLIAAKNLSAVGECGNDGSLHFFKKDSVIQSVFFRMNEANCMQFSFLQDKKYIATELNAEAKQLLENVKK